MKQRFRIAFRVEGEMWCAYLAPNDTMENSMFLGSIRMSIVMRTEELKESFMAIMRMAMTDIIEKDLGIKQMGWDTKIAPDHERSGNS